MQQFQGILFDLDGVLIDSEPIHNLKWVEALSEYKIRVDQSWLNKFIGVQDKLIAQEIVETFELPVTSERLLEEKRWKYRQYICSELAPFPELAVAIKSLQEYKLGIVTSSEKAEVDLITQKMGINSLFDIIVGGDEIINNKPCPDIYLKAIKMLGVVSSQCIAIEDSFVGVQSAKSAGLFVIAIANSLFYSEMIKAADYICENTLSAISYIKSLNLNYG